MLKALFGQVRPGVSPFVVAIAGVGLAYLWKKVDVVPVLAITILFVVIGVVGYLAGKFSLNQERPAARAARWRFEWTVAVPIGIAALAAAAIIVLAIDYASDKAWSEERKQLTAAVVAAITTFLTTAFVKGTGDSDAGWVGDLVKNRFEVDLKGRFPSGSTARDAVFDRVRGWDRSNRQKRAIEIDDYIKAGKEVIPRTGEAS